MIKLDHSNIGDLEKEYVLKALDSGYVSTAGPLVEEFENAVSEVVGFQGVATNSGTSALHLALLDAEIGKGDKVILPATSFIATANTVKYVQATPVFVDVDINNWCINSENIARELDTALAIIGVDLYGNRIDWERIDSEHAILIEDSAGSFGANPKHPLMPDYYCYSFNGNKIMTTGSGGLVVGPRDSLKRFASVGKDSIGEFEEVGYNYKMNNIQAALGLAQLRRMPEFLKKKKEFYEIYRNELPFLTFQKQENSNHWYTACLLPEIGNVDFLTNYLRMKGIETRRVFRPITYYKPYRKYAREFPNARYIYDHGICLPMSTLNTKENIYYVCKTIRRLFEK